MRGAHAHALAVACRIISADTGGDRVAGLALELVADLAAAATAPCRPDSDVAAGQ